MDKLISRNSKFVFISPHLDDVAFSSGGLLDILANKNKKITVINVFTKATKPPYGISIKKFLNSCGYKDAETLYKDRVAEDFQALNKLKIKVINLNLVDALWRKRKMPGNTFVKFFLQLVPDLGYIYPIFRFTIARGYIAKEDSVIISQLEKLLEKHVKEDKDTVVLCPSAIGKHTDHLIVRQVASRVFKRVVYWEDFPYSKTKKIDNAFVSKYNLKNITIKFDRNRKDKLINLYHSQIKAIFGSEIAKSKSTEDYYLNW